MIKVLIVEDQVAYQQILKESLEKEHFEVFLSSDTEQATKDVEETPPDIILLDIMLPGGTNGFDFLERLKAEEKTKNIPVIIITNLSSEEKVSKEIGVAYYFIKSETTIDEIIKKVKETLNI